MFAVLLSCLAVLLALGVVERLAARRAYAAVPVRIHVNGTRGKSAVTRLVAAALREAGIPTVAKVTGTAPRLIRADGTEEPVRRLAPANIREQGWLLREARRAGARAVVAECMAVRPDLQWVSEHEMVRATIGVITNARLDHGEVMGRSVEEVARSLASSIPRGGVLVVGDGRFADLFAARCAALGTRLAIARQPEGARDPLFGGIHWQAWQENVAVALAVTRELAIPDEVAMSGFVKAAHDPGAVSSGTAVVGRRQVEWIDATAANDPESLDLLVSARLKPCPTVVVFNHRGDRPARLHAFARHSDAFRRGSLVLVTGDRPALTLLAAARRCCPGAGIRFIARRRLAAAISAAADRLDAGRVIFCGNTRGWTNPLTNDQRPTTLTNNQQLTTNNQRPC